MPLNLPDLPEVSTCTLKQSQLVPGSLLPHPDGLTVTQLLVKHLKLVLSEHSKSRELAEEHEIIFAYEEGLLVALGDPQSELDYILACWKDPDLRVFFDALELTVVEAP